MFNVLIDQCKKMQTEGITDTRIWAVALEHLFCIKNTSKYSIFYDNTYGGQKTQINVNHLLIFVSGS